MVGHNLSWYDEHTPEELRILDSLERDLIEGFRGSDIPCPDEGISSILDETLLSEGDFEFLKPFVYRTPPSFEDSEQLLEIYCEIHDYELTEEFDAPLMRKADGSILNPRTFVKTPFYCGWKDSARRMPCGFFTPGKDISTYFISEYNKGYNQGSNDLRQKPEIFDKFR